MPDIGSTIPCSAQASSPALAVPLTATLRALRAIEELPETSTGALLFSRNARPLGTVLLEHGRVCWACAQHMSRRLTDILRSQRDPPLSARALEEVYRRCREQHTPLGETLVRSGIVSQHGLRSALRQHNAEALTLLGAAPSEIRFHPRGKTLYNAQFTFSTAELLISAGALHDTASTARARLRLRQCAENGTLGVAFRNGRSDQPLPIAASGADEVTAGELMDFGRWLADLGDLSSAVTSGQRLIATTYPDGSAVVGWVEHETTYAILCKDRRTSNRVLTKVARMTEAR